ncbi:MAG: hypothetical protein WBX02_12125 [Terriglobales bacterium]
MSRMQRFFVRFLLLYALLNLCLLLCACSTSWVTEAEGIIAALTPAVQGILVLLASLGAAIAPAVISSIQSWGEQAQNDLQNVVLPLIQQYNTAETTAQPGILTEISTAMATIVNGLTSILPSLHIDDPATQLKVQDVVTEVADEMQALLNLIPVIKGATSPADALRALAAHPEVVTKLKSEKQFKKDYNAKIALCGTQFKNWIK